MSLKNNFYLLLSGLIVFVGQIIGNVGFLDNGIMWALFIFSTWLIIIGILSTIIWYLIGKKYYDKIYLVISIISFFLVLT
tara:strand:+ start:63 stop:302 length:240 start_codon:yes stop_codon:yes gene_type:complete